MAESCIGRVGITRKIKRFNTRAIVIVETMSEQPFIGLCHIEKTGRLRVVHTRDSVVDQSRSLGIGGFHGTYNLVTLGYGYGAVGSSMDDP